MTFGNRVQVAVQESFSPSLVKKNRFYLEWQSNQLKDYISQRQLQLLMTMWPSSGEWYKQKSCVGILGKLLKENQLT